MEGDARQEAELKTSKTSENCVLSFSVNVAKHPTGVRQKRKTRGKGATASQFWKHSLGNSYGVAKTMFARAISKVAGSEARREGRERDCFI